MIINILKYIEAHLIDDELYFHVPDCYRTRVLSIYWQKKVSRKLWQVKDMSTQATWHLTTADLVAFIQTQNLDVLIFEQKLTDVIVNQVVLARQLNHEAKRLFGSEALESYVIQAEKFYENLLQIVASTLNRENDQGDSSKQSLKTLKERRKKINLKLVN